MNRSRQEDRHLQGAPTLAIDQPAGIQKRESFLLSLGCAMLGVLSKTVLMPVLVDSH